MTESSNRPAALGSSTAAVLDLVGDVASLRGSEDAERELPAIVADLTARLGATAGQVDAVVGHGRDRTPVVTVGYPDRVAEHLRKDFIGSSFGRRVESVDQVFRIAGSGC